MKAINNNHFFKITTLVLALVLASVFFMGMKADTSPNIPLGYSASHVSITIEKPKGWLTKETAVKITVASDLKLSKVEAKTSNNGQWQDITDDMVVELSDNATVYVQVTDGKGRIYNKSRYLEVFDRTNPTIKAWIDKSLLRVEAEDDLSGISAIYIDGERYDELVNGMLDVKLSSLGKEYADISIQAVDKAGNKSAIVTLKNPNYKEEVTETATPTQSSITPEPPAGSGSTTTETSGTATGTNTTAPTSTTTNATTSTATGGNEIIGNADNVADNSNNGNSSETPLFGTFEDTNKQFMSIVTKDGQVFYMIIDHDKPSENVYLLTEATEADLQSFSPEAETPMEDYTEYIGKDKPEEEIGFVEDIPEPSAENTLENMEIEEKVVPREPAKGGSPGTMIFVIILIALVAGAGYYFKIYKPKKELESADDLDDYVFEEDEDSFFGDDVDEQERIFLKNN